MVSFRRLLTVFLAVALMQFSIAATAPAHAHEGDAPHGVPVVVLDSSRTSPLGAVESGHGHGHDRHDHELGCRGCERGSAA